MAFTMASVGADSKSIHERRRPAENAVRPLMIGPVTYTLALRSPTDTFPPNLLKSGSRIAMSVIDDILPPYLAGNDAL